MHKYIGLLVHFQLFLLISIHRRTRSVHENPEHDQTPETGFDFQLNIFNENGTTDTIFTNKMISRPRRKHTNTKNI